MPFWKNKDKKQPEIDGFKEIEEELENGRWSSIRSVRMNYDKKKWITMEITLMTPYSELIRLKSALKPYVEELGWEIETGRDREVEDYKDGDKTERISITLAPKEGIIDPVDFFHNKEKIVGLLFSIVRDIVYAGDHEKAQEEFKHTIFIGYTQREGQKTSKEDYTVREAISFLNYSYKLIDRINFEKKHKKIAVKLFGKTIKEEVRSLFDESSDENIREDMKRLYGFEID